jgi:hypothetical protein
MMTINIRFRGDLARAVDNSTYTFCPRHPKTRMTKG